MGDDRLDKVLEHLHSIHAKCDQLKADNAKLHARLDAMEAKSSAAEKERDDAAAAAAKQADAASEADRGKYADAQMRWDAAYQAYSQQAPRPLSGESLLHYRLRLARGMQQHSKTYKDSNLAAIGDEQAFNNVEGAIIQDAVKASIGTVVHGAPLRAQTKIDPDTQHRVTRFYGDPGVCWSEFSGGYTKFGKINQALVDRAHRAANS